MYSGNLGEERNLIVTKENLQPTYGCNQPSKLTLSYN